MQHSSGYQSGVGGHLPTRSALREAATKAVKNLVAFALFLAISAVVIWGLIQIGGVAIGEAQKTVENIGGPWQGNYTSDYAPANDTSSFKSLENCQAWGAQKVKADGGSYQCGLNCEQSTEYGTLNCDQVYP